MQGVFGGSPMGDGRWATDGTQHKIALSKVPASHLGPNSTHSNFLCPHWECGSKWCRWTTLSSLLSYKCTKYTIHFFPPTSGIRCLSFVDRIYYFLPAFLAAVFNGIGIDSFDSGVPCFVRLLFSQVHIDSFAILVKPVECCPKQVHCFDMIWGEQASWFKWDKCGRKGFWIKPDSQLILKPTRHFRPTRADEAEKPPWGRWGFQGLEQSWVPFKDPLMFTLIDLQVSRPIHAYLGTLLSLTTEQGNLFQPNTNLNTKETRTDNSN